ncbi:DNA alkylation repair protein [Nocardioides solisilvae]|uniref:DNA alkylation repair protein n=1 Tax=Nocardioides solisilvae TaxID=1542435 RepID=UPI00194EC0EE|nr:DNA alkylation repair protein [Nocardioides solisilvae]
MKPTAADVRRALAERADPVDAAHLARFFQVRPGGYGEGDVFVGVRVPAVRAVARRYADLPLAEVRALLDDREHEHRLAALVVAVEAFRRALRPRTADPALRARLHALYLDALRAGRVNSWDLVDVSAEWLVGEHLRTSPGGEDGGEGDEDGGAHVVEELLADPDLWRRRAGVMASFAATKAGDPGPALVAAAAVLDDRRDLVQKAAGWMLREVGKRVDRKTLVDFLRAHAPRMGRTALSYATEHLDPGLRAELRRR